jgi:hypothetical protein
MEMIPAQACVLSAATQLFTTRRLAELAGGRHSITALLRLLQEAGNLMATGSSPVRNVGPSGVAAVFVALSGEGLARCRKGDALAAIAHTGADRHARESENRATCSSPWLGTTSTEGCWFESNPGS